MLGISYVTYIKKKEAIFKVQYGGRFQLTQLVKSMMIE